MAHPRGQTYVGCRFRWHGGTMWLPPAAERLDAVIDPEVVQVSADVVEFGDGVRVAKRYHQGSGWLRRTRRPEHLRGARAAARR